MNTNIINFKEKVLEIQEREVLLFEKQIEREMLVKAHIKTLNEEARDFILNGANCQDFKSKFENIKNKIEILDKEIKLLKKVI